jgi:hypothetical protein
MKRRDLSITAILTVFAAAVASASPLGPALFPHHEGLIFWGSVGVGGAALLCLIPFFIWQPRKEIDVSDDAEVGEDNVVMGKHNFRKIGNRNVIIGATDDRGNTILNKPMTVGYGARGGPGSIVIGAFAEAKGRRRDGRALTTQGVIHSTRSTTNLCAWRAGRWTESTHAIQAIRDP